MTNLIKLISSSDKITYPSYQIQNFYLNSRNFILCLYSKLLCYLMPAVVDTLHKMFVGIKLTTPDIVDKLLHYILFIKKNK